MSGVKSADTEQAVQFLCKMYRRGPWALTSVQVDKKGLATRTFTAGQEADMREWIALYNGHRNIYWHVNPVLRPVAKKAKRKDIKAVCYLHVDVDPSKPPPGMDAKVHVAAEQDRLLRMLTEGLPKGVPSPSVIVFSGGGYGAFWRLDSPILVDGDLKKAEEAKRYNQQLETVFGGDNCHNIDRLMRLPGTLNIPDGKKVAKGRVPTMARLVHLDTDAVYPISRFIAKPKVSAGGDDEFTGSTIYPQCRVQLTGGVERLSSIDELDQYEVPDRLKVVCVQGYDPDRPKDGDNSRSAWLHDCVCNLLRFGVPDDVIFSIITDPGFSISDSVLEMPNPSEVAVRQIERGKEQSVDPNLVELNTRYAVISNWGGKCRVLERVEDPALGRSRISKLSFEDLRNAWMHKTVKVGQTDKGVPVLMKKGHWWLEHRQRRQYRSLVFVPGKEVNYGYNLWQGFAVEAKPGDCSMLVDHVARNVCRGSKEHFDYLMGWMARAVQFPATPGEVAVVMRGKRGVGKSILAKLFGRLWGSHYMEVSNSSHLVGNFNAHLRDVVFMHAAEAFFAGDRKHVATLKSIITDELLPLESKGVDVEMGPNYLHIMMSSNDQHVIPAGGDERRFFVLDVGDGNHQDHAFFKSLMEQMEAGGYEAFLHTLLSWDLSGFNVRRVPTTAALQEQKLLSLSPEEEWWYQKLVHGRVLEDHEEWQTVVIKGDVVMDYANTMRRFSVHHRGSATQLGKYLHRLVPSIATKQKRVRVREHIGDGVMVTGDLRRCYHWVFPTLEECRRHWEARYGPEEWGTVEVEVDEESGSIPF